MIEYRLTQKNSMKNIILTENAAGGIVGDDKGNVYILNAIEMGNLSEEDANFYVPVNNENIQDAPDEIPESLELKEYTAPNYGLKVKAFFSKDESLWYVAI